MTSQELIARLKLAPLPGEGGYFRQTVKAGNGAITAIYYVVTPEEFSALHRVPKIEIFHFYAGDPVELVQIDPMGEAKRQVLGNRLERGEEPQAAVASGVWQGTRLLDGGKWALLGCTVAPGFEDGDLEVASRAELTRRYPRHRDWILRFTRE